MIGSVRKHAFGEPAPEKKPRKYRETKLQKKVVAWLRARPDWMVLRLENSQQRTPGTVMRDKAMGLHPGAPDLIVIYKHNLAWLELKDGTGLSTAQRDCHEELNRRDQVVLVGVGFENTIEGLINFAHTCNGARFRRDAT